MRNFYLSLIILLLSYGAKAQKHINTTNSKAVLGISTCNTCNDTSTNSKLISKNDGISTTNLNRYQYGRFVFILDNSVYTKGFYYWNKHNSQWINIASNNGIKIYHNIATTSTSKSYNQSMKSFTINNKGLVINNANINKQISYHIDVNKDLYVDKFSDYRINNNTYMGLATGYNEKNNWYLKPNDLDFIVLGIKTIQEQIEKQQTELNDIKGVLDNYDELNSRVLALENKKLK